MKSRRNNNMHRACIFGKTHRAKLRAPVVESWEMRVNERSGPDR